MLPEDVDYGAWDYFKDPSMWSVTPVELIIFWKRGYIHPSTSVVFLVMFPFMAGIAASVVGLLLYGYIFLIPLSIYIAILTLVITPMLLESGRTHLSMGTIASLKRRDRSRQINMGFVVVAIVTVILLFALVDSGAFESGARLQITVESNHFFTITYVVYVNGSLIESGILEPHESTTFDYVHRWSSPEPTNLTILVKWGFLPSEPMFSYERAIEVVHGEFYVVNLGI